MKIINKDLMVKAETIARKMSNLKIGSYSDLRIKILRDLFKARLEEINADAQKELQSIK